MSDYKLVIETAGKAKFELVKILIDIAGKIQDGYTNGDIGDVSGGYCFKLKEEKEE